MSGPGRVCRRSARRWPVYPLIWLALLGVIALPSDAAPVPVEVKGAGARLTDNIRVHIGPVEAEQLTQPRQLERKLAAAISEASEALGFYRTTFSWRVEQTARGNRLALEITPGPRLRWAEPQLQVEGGAAERRAVAALLARQPFKVGAPVIQQQYDEFKRNLLETVIAAGYLDAAYRESRLLLDAEQETGTAVLTLASGPLYRFGDVRFQGSKLNPDLLHRLVPFEPRSPYRREALTDLYRDLQDSLYFNTVSVRTRPQADQTVAVDVELEDAPRHRFAVGAGFGTDTGPRVRLRWERPQVSASGHQLTTETWLSAPQQELTAKYRIPLARPLWQSVTASATLERFDIEDTDSTIASLGLFYSDRLSDYWYGSVGATLENETYRQGSQPRQRVSYLVPALNFNGLLLPKVADPLSGNRTWLRLSGSDQSLGADTRFLRAVAGHKRILHLGGHHLLVVRGEVGVITTDEIELIPASQRFFTGGDQTVRGYDFESLGPRDVSGKLVGGRYLNVASAEYSFKFAEQWRFALFTDAGRAFNDSDASWHQSAGIGVRWLSPIGQIRVDLAVPVKSDESGFQLHVFMGPPL